MVGDKKAEEAQQTAAAERARLSKTIEKLIAASIGAVALGQEALGSLLNRMVERGEQVQEAASMRADALKKQSRHLLGRGTKAAENLLDTADLPSKADIQSLQQQIAGISAKVDHLSEEKAKRTT